jgi:hypothetical protein
VAHSLSIYSVDLNKDAVGTLSTRVRTHGLVRAARCLLCGALHQQYYVGVVLCQGEQPLGDVCPRCLSLPPERCAWMIWEYAARLWDEVGAGLIQAGYPWPPEESAEERQRRAEDQRRREHERRQRLAGPVSELPESGPVTQAEKEHLADLLLGLAQEVDRLREWPTSLEALQEAEWEAIQAQHAELPPGVVWRQVQARYAKLATAS